MTLETKISARERVVLRELASRVRQILLKDTHTIENDPSRLTRWVQIAREEAAMARA
ncbi:MAG: hypothetical protein WCH98_07920 [Verrucomicrobiota bacterium]